MTAGPLHPDDRPHNDPRLERPGTMRAIWPSTCRGCDEGIAKGAVQALAPVPDGRRGWVHADCADHARPTADRERE